MAIQGLHHITLVASNAQQTTDFYTGVLGLRLVKKTVNFDDPGSYHLYFGSADAAPGSLLTFFEWPDAPKGAAGIGGTHHVALRVPDRTALLQWKRRLTDLDIPVQGPYDRHYFTSIYLRDPDGQVLEIATDGPGFTADEPLATLGETYQAPPEAMTLGGRDGASIAEETWPEPVPEILPSMALSQGMHHITAIGADIQRTHAFYADLLGLRRVKQTSNFDDAGAAHWYWGDAKGQPGTLITYFEWPPEQRRRARMGRGQTHHFAFAVADDEAQQAWLDRFRSVGWPVSPIRDRVYFKSIYTQDPDGHIVELATNGPGFFVDEEETTLGTGLMLPPWLASRRRAIEAQLTPIQLPS